MQIKLPFKSGLRITREDISYANPGRKVKRLSIVIWLFGIIENYFVLYL